MRRKRTEQINTVIKGNTYVTKAQFISKYDAIFKNIMLELDADFIGLVNDESFTSDYFKCDKLKYCEKLLELMEQVNNIRYELDSF